MTLRLRGISILPGFDRARWLLVIDCLAVGVAVSLPWSTSLTGIFIALWVIAVLPVLDIGALRRVLTSAAGFLPVLLWALAAIGMLWAFDASWADRLGGFGKFHRLLVIPLLLMHFQRSARGMCVLYGFFFATLALLAVSWGLALLPGLTWRGVRGAIGVPVKDYIFQSDCFLLCGFVLLDRVIDGVRARRWPSSAGFAAIAVLFLADIFFVVTSRTALVVAPFLLLLLGWREFRWKGLLGAVLLGGIIAGAVWSSSPYMRERLTTTVSEWQSYRSSDAVNSTGLRAEFLRKSLLFVKSAPILGHGTGSIPELFRKAAVGEGASAAVAENPHSQIFAIAIQLGVVGAIVLAAMWIAHLLLFSGGGFVAWVGLVVVAENVLSSVLNSHLFDFGESWLYVFGVGVCGGMVLRLREPKAALC